MRARIIFLFVILIPFFIFADEFKLTNMGDGYYFLQEPEVDYVLNVAYLTRIHQAVFGSFIEYQNLQYMNPQPNFALNLNQCLLPDTRFGYKIYRSQRIYGFILSRIGIFAFDVRRNYFTGKFEWRTFTPPGRDFIL